MILGHDNILLTTSTVEIRLYEPGAQVFARHLNSTAFLFILLKVKAHSSALEIPVAVVASCIVGPHFPYL